MGVFAGLIVSIVISPQVNAQDLEALKNGVVKITSTTLEGKRKIGTGIIVKVEEEEAYILTASHVVEGDVDPEIVFYSDKHHPFPGKVLHLEGGDPRGLAVLLVEAKMKHSLKALPLEPLKALRLEPWGSGYEPSSVQSGISVFLIGFPRTPPIPWFVTKPIISGQDGRLLAFSGNADEGTSGGPLIFNNEVVGIVTETFENAGYAVPSNTALFALRGWGIPISEPKKDEIAKLIPIQPQIKIPENSVKSSAEITGKDGAPMVLVPAGKFIMGSPGNVGDEDEHPEHQVYIDTYYIDKYEVTTERYYKFMQATDREKPV